MSFMPLKSWSGIMGARHSEKIEVNAQWLFESSKFRIGKIKLSHCDGAQKNEPFVICKADYSSYVYGSASLVRNDASLLVVSHLDSNKLLEYINKYERNINDEPRNKFLSLLHKQYQNGNMSVASIQPLLTEQQWQQRAQIPILHLKNQVQQHLLKVQENKLHMLDKNNTSQKIIDLQRDLLYNYEHLMSKFLNTSIYNKMNFRNKDSVMGASMSGIFCTHMVPSIFSLYLKKPLLSMGGKQTVYKANEECWKVENLDNDKASKLLCIHYNNGERLTKQDPKNDKIEYSVTNVCCHYSMKTLKFGIKYRIEYSDGSRKHRRK